MGQFNCDQSLQKTNFGKPTGEFGTVERANEDDAVVKWDDDGCMRLRQLSLNGPSAYSDKGLDFKGPSAAVVTTGGAAFFNCSSSA